MYAKGYPASYNRHKMFNLFDGGTSPPPPPPPSPPVAPNPPDIVSDSLNFDGMPGAINIDFVADSDNQTVPVFDPLLYYMQYSETSGSGFNTFGDAWTLPVDARTVTLIGLMFDTTYYIRSAVEYDNGGTQTAYSDEYTITTPEPPPAPAPAPYFQNFAYTLDLTTGEFTLTGEGIYDPTWYTRIDVNEVLLENIAENIGTGTKNFVYPASFSESIIFDLFSKRVASPDPIYGQCDFYTTRYTQYMPAMLDANDHDDFGVAYDCFVVTPSDALRLVGYFGGKEMFFKITSQSAVSTYVFTLEGDSGGVIVYYDESTGLIDQSTSGTLTIVDLPADTVIYIKCSSSFDYFDFRVT